jgi:hypothetical protein
LIRQHLPNNWSSAIHEVGHRLSVLVR